MAPMAENQIVTITFFRFEGFKNRFWAFRQMGLSPFLLKNITGLQFAKMLGSGGGNGFSSSPNWGVYGLLAVWKSEDFAQQFFATHFLFRKYLNQSSEHWTVFLRTVMAHGQWDGKAPFQITESPNDEQLVAVLTRATIRTQHLWRFWQFVPPVSRSVEHREGLLFSVGIGELPIIQQATFSLWKNSHYMKAYAYKSPHHSEVVKKTRELGWYKEELFARFLPYNEGGSWQGKRFLGFERSDDSKVG